MKDEITRCDICSDIILYPNCNGAIWPGQGQGQAWPTDGGKKDVCDECIQVLMKADDIGIIEIDMAPLYERAGFVWEDNRWTRARIVI